MQIRSQVRYDGFDDLFLGKVGFRTSSQSFNQVRLVIHWAPICLQYEQKLPCEADLAKSLPVELLVSTDLQQRYEVVQVLSLDLCTSMKPEFEVQRDSFIRDEVDDGRLSAGKQRIRL